MAPDTSLAAEIEAVIKDPVAVHLNMLRGTIAKPSIENIIHLYGRDALIAALQSRAFEDGARPHVAEALKREAQSQDFRRDLAERCYASLKERLLKAAHKAFTGDDRALRRLVDTLENPVPIQGSAALQPEGERSDA